MYCDSTTCGDPNGGGGTVRMGRYRNAIVDGIKVNVWIRIRMFGK